MFFHPADLRAPLPAPTSTAAETLAVGGASEIWTGTDPTNCVLGLRLIDPGGEFQR